MASLDTARKLELLQWSSHLRAKSNAYVETQANAALIAFLQVEQVKNDIESMGRTVHAIEQVVDFMMSVALNVGGTVVKAVTKKMMESVVNSRFMVGQFVASAEDYKPAITDLYDGSVKRRFSFENFEKALEAQRAEHEYLTYVRNGVGYLYGEKNDEIKKAVLEKGSASSPGLGAGLSPTVSLVDSALNHAVVQKLATNVRFDTFDNAVRLDVIRDDKTADEMVKELAKSSLYQAIRAGGRVLSLNDASDLLKRQFELIIWAMLFTQRHNPIRLESVTDDKARLVFFDDIGQDRELTLYLINRFNEYEYKRTEKVRHRANNIRRDFYKIRDVPKGSSLARKLGFTQPVTG